MAESEKQNLMPKSVWNGIRLVAAIVGGTLFVQSEIKDTLKETIQPLVNRIEKLETTLIEVTQAQAIQTYKIQVIEQTAKEFIKPSEYEFKKKKK